MLLKAFCHLSRYAKKRGWNGTTKTIRIMKVTGILLLAAVVHVSARTVAQTVTYSAKTAPLVNVFSAIEQQTGYVFFYNSRDLQGAVPVTVNLDKTPLKDALERVLSEEPLSFDIQGNTIVITRKVQPETPSPTMPPPGEIHGRITDSLGNPLEGVNISVAGTKKVTTTGANGEFILKGVDNDATLMISSVGYEARVIRLAGRQDIGVVLREAVKSLVDVVVNKGYYTTTDRLNTGDVTTVKGEDIQKQPVSDPIFALEGRVPGLYIQQTSGVPGSYGKIEIRGQNSIANGNDPLYIVDGVPFSSVSLTNPTIGGGANSYPGGVSAVSNNGGGGISPFSALNPADIESVVVLKDADATAIYGSRGANGVILITTKRGKSGATRFDINVYTGSGQVTRMMHLLNSSQYMKMMHEAYNNDSLPFPSITANPQDNNYDIDGVWDTTRNTNWQKVLIRNMANFTNAQGTLTGGNENTQFVASAGYSKQGTVYIGNYFDEKASAHLNLTHASLDHRFHLQLGANYIYDNSHLPPTDFTSYALTLPPDAPALYDKYGNFNWVNFAGSPTFYNNPAALTVEDFRAATNNLISNLNLSYQLFPGFQLKSSFGYNRDEMNQSQLMPASAVPPPGNTISTNRYIFLANTFFTSWIIEPQLNYQRLIGAGRLEALVGSSFQQSNHNTISTFGYGFTSDALITDPAAAAHNGVGGNSSTLYRYNAFYGRLSYNWKDKYLVNLTARRDGSSRFGPGKQFGNFGAAGIGWIFTKENFIQKSLPFLSFGKLRGSYGSTGNDQIADYQFLSTYSVLTSSYQGVSGLYPLRLTNPYFAWELVKKLEGGIDLGFLKDRILVSASFFRNRTGNQLVGEVLPAITGFNTIQFNLPAVVQNTGWEFVLNTINFRTKDFSWTTSGNLTIPSNKLVSFPNIQNFGAYNSEYTVGKSLFSQKVFHSTGVNSQTGLYTFATKNVDGIPTSPQDLVSTRPVTQKFYGGLNNTFSYKGFEVSIFLQYVNQVGYNYNYSFPPPGLDGYNEPTAVLNRWTTVGNLTNTQRFGTNSTNQNLYTILQSSDAAITGASFLRLKNMTLSYQLPAKWKTGIRLQTARIYVQCQNLVTATKYVGMDPETGVISLPPLRMITAGLQVGL